MMWAHYGATHRGVCLVLDRRGLEGAVSRKFGSDALFAPISYVSGPEPGAWTPLIDASEIARLGPGPSAERTFEAHRRELLFQKNQEWQVEREWRCCIDHQPRKGVVDVSLGGDVVAGLVVGMSVPERRLDLVRSVATALGVVKGVAVNVIDTVPLSTTGAVWRYLSGPELDSLGHTSH
jgi:hypothetical protein